VLLEVLNRDLGHLENALVRQCLIAVEEHEQEHLVGGREELVALVEGATEFSRAQAELPVQLSTIVELGEVELCKGSHRICDLLWQ